MQISAESAFLRTMCLYLFLVEVQSQSSASTTVANNRGSSLHTQDMQLRKATKGGGHRQLQIKGHGYCLTLYLSI